MKYFFVTGAHKSGTSWLANMLAAHPEIAIPRQELWMFGHPSSLTGPAMDALIDNWLALPTVATERAEWNVDDIRTRLKRAVSVTVLNQYKTEGINAIGEKTPLFTVRGVETIHAAFPGAYLIMINRDGRDVVVSHHFHNLRLENYSLYDDEDLARAARAYHVTGESDTPVPLLSDRTIRDVARNWAECAGAHGRIQALFKGRFINLSYEDLLSNTLTFLADIFEQLSVDAGEARVAEIVGAHSFEAVSGGRKPGEMDAGSFFRKGIVGDWQSYFDARSADIFNELAGEQLLRLGYADTLDWCTGKAVGSNNT